MAKDFNVSLLADEAGAESCKEPAAETLDECCGEEDEANSCGYGWRAFACILHAGWVLAVFVLLLQLAYVADREVALVPEIEPSLPITQLVSNYLMPIKKPLSEPVCPAGYEFDQATSLCRRMGADLAEVNQEFCAKFCLETRVIKGKWNIQVFNLALSPVMLLIFVAVLAISFEVDLLCLLLMVLKKVSDRRGENQSKLLLRLANATPHLLYGFLICQCLLVAAVIILSTAFNDPRASLIWSAGCIVDMVDFAQGEYLSVLYSCQLQLVLIPPVTFAGLAGVYGLFGLGLSGF